MKKKNNNNSANENYDILKELKRLPVPEYNDDEFLSELHRKIEERNKPAQSKEKGFIDSLIEFIREHIFISTIGLTAMIAVIYFSVNYFSDDRIKISHQPYNNIIVDLTQYRNLKLVPSIPDSTLKMLRSSVLNIPGMSKGGERVQLFEFENFLAKGAKGSGFSGFKD